MAAYFGGKMLFPDRGYEVPEPAAPGPAQAAKPGAEKPRSTGNPEIDALLDERARAVSEMRRLNDSIKDYAEKKISKLDRRPPPGRSSTRWWRPPPSCPRSANS